MTVDCPRIIINIINMRKKTIDYSLQISGTEHQEIVQKDGLLTHNVGSTYKACIESTLWVHASVGGSVQYF